MFFLSATSLALLWSFQCGKSTSYIKEEEEYISSQKSHWRSSEKYNTYGVRLFVEPQNGGSCNWLLCVQHHPFLGDSLWSWRLCRACHWHLCKCVDQVIELNGKALQTFLYFPEKQTEKVLLMYLDPISWSSVSQIQEPKKNPYLKPTSHEYVPYAHHWPLFAAIHFHPLSPTALRTTLAVASHDWPWGSYTS